MHATLLGMDGLWNTLHLLRFVLVLAIAVTTPALYAKDPVTVRASALIQLTGAKDVSYDVYKGRERLTYSIYEEYPAPKSLDQIRSRLRALGWTPLDDNYFMPGGDRPYQIPLNYGYKDNSFYIHSAREGKKIELLKANNLVHFQIETGVEVKNTDQAYRCGTNYECVMGYLLLR